MEFLSILGFIGFLVGLLVFILLMRFIIVVPDQLVKIAKNMEKFGNFLQYRDVDPSDDLD